MQTLSQGPQAPAVEIKPMVPQDNLQNNPMPAMPGLNISNEISQSEAVQTPQVMPTESPIPTFGMETNMAPVPPVTQEVNQPETPLFTANPVGTEATFAESNSNITQNVAGDIPLFANTEMTSTNEGQMSTPLTTPSAEPQVMNEQPAVVPDTTMPAMEESPLFANPNPMAPAENTPAIAEQPVPVYDVPVMSEPVVEQDKLSQVEEFLNNNGIGYKKYSNESSHCIIIEL